MILPSVAPALNTHVAALANKQASYNRKKVDKKNMISAMLNSNVQHVTGHPTHAHGSTHPRDIQQSQANHPEIHQSPDAYALTESQEAQNSVDLLDDYDSLSSHHEADANAAEELFNNIYNSGSVMDFHAEEDMHAEE